MPDKNLEGIRKSGITNMFDINRVIKLTGLNKEKVIAIMKNYNELNDKFNFRK